MKTSPLPTPSFLARVLPLAGALGSGLLVALASPPFDLWPLAFFCLAPLLIALRQATPCQAAGLGWVFGMAAFLFGTPWWPAVLQRFADLSLPAAVGLYLLFSAWQALAYAFWAWAGTLIIRRYGTSPYLTMPLCLAIAEITIPFFFKTYLGIALYQAWPLIQVAELGGPPAVSALLVLINLLVVETGYALLKHEPFTRQAKAAVLVLVLITATGWGRAAWIESARLTSPALPIGIVQPNFGIVSLDERKHNGERYVEILRTATDALEKHGVELIVWPETAWPFPLDRQMKKEFPADHPWKMRQEHNKARLIAGALTHTFGSSEIYNSAVLFAADGTLQGIYDKMRLVPFSEEIPFKKRYPEWTKRVHERTPLWPDITKGDKPRLLTDGNLKAGLLICSEDMDMAYCHTVARQGANLLAAIASDAWFGESGAPAQHLALATFRAVETRRDLVRAANTGISAIVEATGRVSQKGPLTAGGGREARPELLTWTAHLLQTPALAPTTARFFPLACLIILVAGIVCDGMPRQVVCAAAL